MIVLVTCRQFHQYLTSNFLNTIVFYAAFLQLQFDFVNFWKKNIGTKAAGKMLLKLTTGVNF